MSTKPGSLLLGLDIGTSGVKALLVALDGAVVASHTAPLSLQTPRPGWAEQDPGEWWDATLAAIRAVGAARGAGLARVAAVGITGQQHSSVFLDAAGAVIRPALLWCDGRTSAECREITQRVGGEAAMRRLVCNPAIEGFTLPKVLWLRNHEPAAFARLAKVLMPKDYIRYRLTSTLGAEPSDASGTLMFDPVKLGWSPEMMAAMDLPMSLLPDLGGSAEILGRLTADAAKLTGLPAGAPVVGGGGDNACGAAGVGAVSAGDAVASWGTSGTVLAVTDRPLVDPGLRAHTFCHVMPHVWYVIGVVLTAGGAYAWYTDRLTGGADYATLDREAEAVPAGAEGVMFLPYLQGERTPWRDAALRGAFTGLSLAHGRGHLTRAVIEGVCFALNDSLTIIRELGLGPAELLLTGGGAKSAFVRRLQSEVYGIPVRTVNREEGPAYGAALLAAVGAGAFTDLPAATRATLARGPGEVPDPAAVERYRPLYARFRAGIGAARPVTVP